jgi:hypothetical protein
MNKKKFIPLMLSLILMTSSGYCLSASATELSNSLNNVDVYYVASVPNNEAPVYNNESNGYKGISAEDVFHSSDFTGQDQTGYAEQAGNWLQVAAKFVITICVYLFAAFVTIGCGVDALVLAFVPAGWFFANKVPIQLFSAEASEISGVVHSYGSDSKGSGGMGGNSGGSGSKEDRKSKFRAYFLARGKVLIACGLYLTMTYTGLLSMLLNKAIDFIVGLIV